MKRITLLSVFCFSLFSCEKFLDQEQNTQITTGTAWQSESSAKSNVAGMYFLQRSAFQEGFAYWGEYRNGLWEGGRRNGAHEPLSSAYTNRLNGTNSMANWQSLYTTINQANLVLTYLPGVKFGNEADKNTALGGAYFVRAFCYFWIARIWGDAPLELVAYESMQSNKYSDRKPAADLFRQVEQDIFKARELIPNSASSKTVASYGAVEMLATDYYLWKYKVLNGSSADLEAASIANANVLNAGYILEPVFSDVFEKEKAEGEVIFKWPYTMSEFVGGYPSDYLYATTNVTDVELRDKVIPVSPDPQWVNITKEYADFIYTEPLDQRAATSYGKYETYGWINKFSGHLIATERVFDTDIDVYRFADAVLFNAEIRLAQNRFPEAIEALNKIAKRAYGLANHYNGLVGEVEIKEAIIIERKKEFVAEGRLWWDFIRMGVVFQECKWLTGRQGELNVLLWPVHNSSLNSNPNIKQTDGY